MSHKEIIEQTDIAFDFIQKLYLEVSYLIKEIEGLLLEDEEKFIIGKPSGYGINTRSSTGLESNNVHLWLLRKLSVFFIPENSTKIVKGQTHTDFGSKLKLLYLRIILNDSKITQPIINFGVLYNITKTNDSKKWPAKFENIMGHIEYNEKKIFKNLSDLKYKDSYISMHGKLIQTKLYDIQNTDNIIKKIIEPVLKMYKKF